MQLSVDMRAGEALSETYHRVARDADIAENGVEAGTFNGWPVFVCRTDGKLHALINKCTHASSELADGRIRRGSVMCPLHGARFELASGKCIGGTYQPLKIFPVRVSDGWVEVAVPDEKPGHQHAPVRMAG